MPDATAPTAPPPSTPGPSPADDRPYSPGLEGVIGAESAIGLVDGKNGRLLYRGYPIGQLVARGTYAAVAELLWTGEWHPGAELHPGPLPEAVLVALRALPRDARPMDALRTAVSVWGADQKMAWPPTPEQARAVTAFSPTALASFDRIRRGLDPVEPDPGLDLAGGFLQQLTGRAPDRATARALEAYFIVGAEHGLNASTFTARVITATRSDLASAVTGAIGALKGPLHGGAPAEVVNQLHEIGSAERA
jgi:citrate synthase